jgi:hypothetical protein
MALLCDIVVADMTPADWDRLLDYLRRRPEFWEPQADFVAADVLPGSHAELESGRHELLAKGYLPHEVNVWYLGDTLELDLDPRETPPDDQLDLLRELGRLLRRDVALTLEGHPDAVLARDHAGPDKLTVPTPAQPLD